MALTLALALVVAVLVLVVLAWIAVFLGTRRQMTRRVRGRAAAEDRVRPVALAILDGDEALDADGLSEDDAEALASLVTRLSRRVRGESSGYVEAFFRRSGIAARTVGQLGSRRAWRRASAAFALGDMHALGAAPGLVERLDDRDGAVRIAATRSLGRLGADETAAPIFDAIADRRVPWVVGGQALIDIGVDSAGVLRSHASSAGSPARGEAIELLGFVGDAADAPAVLAALGDESSELRERAARALGRLGAESAVLALRHALRDPAPEVALAAASALGEIGDRESLDDLLACANGVRFGPARAAARAAARIDPARVVEAARGRGASPHVAEAADMALIS